MEFFFEEPYEDFLFEAPHKEDIINETLHEDYYLKHLMRIFI